MKSKYSINKTMQRLGYQRPAEYISRGGKYEQSFREVIEGNSSGNPEGLAIDAFMLGMICGKHEERQHRRECTKVITLHFQKGTSNPKVYYTGSTAEVLQIVTEWSKENTLQVIGATEGGVNFEVVPKVSPDNWF